MLCSYSKEFSAASFTEVENVFIREYLPLATDNAVKVYLYGLYLCKNSGNDENLESLSKTLKISVDEIKKSFAFWEEFGLLSVVNENPFSVHYYPVKSAGSVKIRKFKPEKYSDFSKSLQSLFSSRMISTHEYSEYFNVMETFGIKTEAMIMIVKYCIAIRGDDIPYSYVLKVAKDFGNRGITSVNMVEKQLSTYVLHTQEMERVLRALKIKRNPDMDDLKLYNKWTQDLHFEQDNLVFAASKLKKGNMEKLDKFIFELYLKKCFSKNEIADFIDKKQAVIELAIRINKALSVYEEVIDTVVDTYTNKWLSYGFEDETLVFIASSLFRMGKNTLQQMDELIETLRVRGFIDLSSVSDYFESEKNTNAFISKILNVSGVNRRPTPWDKENVNMWKSWNFTDEMILEAAKLASGKNSPIAYMNSVLSSWKNKNVFSPALISEKAESNLNANSQENYNREYEKRRAIAVSRAQNNTEKAMAVDGFRGLYERYYSIEKDLAFAEIANDVGKLALLEKEKVDLDANIAKILSSIGLTIEDLSPKYACEKCNDTGYVGTKRCDCFNKTVS